MDRKNKIIELQQKMFEDFPLSRHMGLKVESFDGHSLILSALLEKNINQSQTAFGGSIFSLAALACWGLLFARAAETEIPINLVIQRGHIDYLKLIEHDFIAKCVIDEKKYLRFLHVLQKKPRSRITLMADLYCDDTICATFVGDFVAVKK